MSRLFDVSHHNGQSSGLHCSDGLASHAGQKTARRAEDAAADVLVIDGKSSNSTHELGVMFHEHRQISVMGMRFNESFQHRS